MRVQEDVRVVVREAPCKGRPRARREQSWCARIREIALRSEAKIEAETKTRRGEGGDVKARATVVPLWGVGNQPRGVAAVAAVGCGEPRTCKREHGVGVGDETSTLCAGRKQRNVEDLRCLTGVVA